MRYILITRFPALRFSFVFEYPQPSGWVWHWEKGSADTWMDIRGIRADYLAVGIKFKQHEAFSA
jgi:hypothetical protein